MSEKNSAKYRLTYTTATGRWIVAITLLSSLYLMAAGNSSLAYIATVLLHIPLGIACVVVLHRWVRWTSTVPTARNVQAIALMILFVVVLSGSLIIAFGHTHGTRWLVLGHGIFSLVGLAVIFASPRATKFFRDNRSLALAAVAVVAVAYFLDARRAQPIVNQVLQPIEMEGAAMGGAGGPFFPSPASTSSGNLIPASYFSESASCGRSGCHGDVVEQWERSAHHFSSFNNQWYRKSIEYLEDIAGPEPVKWCAGCHDQALLFSGMMEKPLSEFVESDEAAVGIGCVGCHGIVNVNGTVGNGAYEIKYPRLHEIATSDNSFVQALHDFALKLDPAPHRETFLKPFHEDQPAEFCSSCHKVHLDSPVNNYRWVRGFNTYDNWQASGVSQESARSFYTAEQPQTCISCHMPNTQSSDAGHRDNVVKAHDFIAANTALPSARGDAHQVQLTTEFLSRGQLSIDIFAISKPYGELSEADTSGWAPILARESTTFATGEERASPVGVGGYAADVVDLKGNLKSGDHALPPGETVRVDVVVRTRGLGHFFPTGTVDAQEAWLEFEARDANGVLLAQSGDVDELGYVDSTAHFYRSLMIDAMGNRIDKRNAWAARSTVYVNLVPPGAADVAHFLLRVPEDVDGPVTVTSRLLYRKFEQQHTEFAFGGYPVDPRDTSFSVHFDNRAWAAKKGAAPIVPIVQMAADTLTLYPGKQDTESASPRHVPTQRERWNDYGIGLLLQGDLKGAENAFKEVTSIDEQYADGWINLSRVYLAEGSLELAATALEQAQVARPGYYKTEYFQGVANKALGEYRQAVEKFERVLKSHPNDRVVLNQLGRTFFLQENLEGAIRMFTRVLAIDSEDLMAHYNLMLCYRALGKETEAQEHELRYKRYKADEASAALALEFRRKYPHHNNEALPIHSH